MNDLEYLLNQLFRWYKFMENEVDDYSLHESYKPLNDVIRRGYIYEYMPFEKKDIKPIDYKIELPQKPILLYSGGKCSTALALEYKNRNPMLFYVGKDNEWIKEFSAELTLDYRVNDIELNHGNPLYLLYIIGLAILYAVEYHYSPIIYVGTFEMSSIHNNPISMWSNCVELIVSFEEVLHQVLPDLQIMLPMPSYSYVWDILMQNKGYLKYVQHGTNVDRMIFEMAKEDWWIEDCENYLLYIKKLRKIYYNEIGYKASLKDFWQRYFFYDIRRSKHIPEMEKLFGE